MLPPKKSKSHMNTTKTAVISKKGKNMPHPAAIIGILKHASKAILLVYPPKYWMKNPPDKTPKVGAVTHIIENMM
jgi:hypothetical protein